MSHQEPAAAHPPPDQHHLPSYADIVAGALALASRIDPHAVRRVRPVGPTATAATVIAQLLGAPLDAPPQDSQPAPEPTLYVADVLTPPALAAYAAIASEHRRRDPTYQRWRPLLAAAITQPGDPRRRDVTFCGHEHPAAYWALPLLQTPEATRRLAYDLDGILCDDIGRLDDDDAAAILDVFRRVRARWPARLGTMRLIVTGRLDRHRDITAAWLALHGYRYRGLAMAPWSTTTQRTTAGMAEFKAQVLAGSRDGVDPPAGFIESDPDQARAIAGQAAMPVACPPAGTLYLPAGYPLHVPPPWLVV